MQRDGCCVLLLIQPNAMHRMTDMPRESSLAVVAPVAPALSCRTRFLSSRASWAAIRGFVTTRCGAVAIETALALSVLIIAFGALVEIVRTAYAGDIMDRAARAAARAVALVPAAAATPHALHSTACAAIRRELDLAPEFDCSTEWVLAVDTGLTAKGLLEDSEDRDGDMVRVRILWDRLPWDIHRSLTDEDEDEDAEDDEVGRLIAIAVARSEPEAEG